MLLIFDFDGTICDSLDAFLKVGNAALGKNFTKKQVRTIGTKKLIEETGMPKINLVRYVLKARKEVQSLIPKLHPVDGLLPILKDLHKKHELCIITSNSKRNVQVFLRKHNIEKYFSIVDDSLAYFGKEKKIIKIAKKLNYPLPECFYIGDETRDIISAKKAGVKSIAVTWGYESEELLKKANPDFIVNKPEELLKLL